MINRGNEEKYKDSLKSILARIPGLTVLAIRDEFPIGTRKVDFDVIYRLEDKTYNLIVEVKSQGTPLAIRTTIESLRKIIPQGAEGKLYPIIAVPYVSALGLEICRETKVGCIDLAGNCYLNFGPVYIEVKGNQNPTPIKPSASFFSPKSSRISRVLLCNVKKLWQVQELAEEAGVSIGLASRIKELFLEEGFLIEEKRLIKLINPRMLLDAWMASYSYKKNRIHEFYSPGDTTTIETTVQTYCINKKINCALTLFSGAARVAPHVIMNKAFLYIEREVADLADTLGFKPVGSGANIMLLEPYESGVFYQPQRIAEDTIVSDVQLYLDLIKYKGRGEEAAEFLRQVRLQKVWQSI